MGRSTSTLEERQWLFHSVHKDREAKTGILEDKTIFAGAADLLGFV